MAIRQITTIYMATAISLCAVNAITCDADLTTKFAIGKRQIEKQIECRREKTHIANCNDVGEVDKAWQKFETINDDYSKAIFECKITQRSKKRRSLSCGCNPPKEKELSHQRTKRSCEHVNGSDIYQHIHRHHHHHHHHQRRRMKATDRMNNTEEALNDRLRRHRHHNAPELQKHERGKHSRAYVHRRHGRLWSPKATSTQRKRHDHGSNDDPKEQEQVPDAHDRSKTSRRKRHGSCIHQAKQETNRLEAKYASLCDRSQICDKENLYGEQKRAMNELSKRRQRIYREYLSIFDRCYGSILL
uniref:Uncharacterized protein n=1 Tax=Parascaris univalens TaxID=6257 RepID=A0A914ZYG4_PARUN